VLNVFRALGERHAAGGEKRGNEEIVREGGHDAGIGGQREGGQRRFCESPFRPAETPGAAVDGADLINPPLDKYLK
jgi:hypothetical protein